MSSVIRCVHPDLKLVPARQVQQIDPNAEAADVEAADIAAAEAVVAFPFEKLPGQIQTQILQMLLHKPGQLIHCISRLDPFVEPATFPSAADLGEHRSGYKNVFYWGERECSITEDGVDPNQLLAILSACKRMFFLSANIFYSLNTFAFSSLGELGRFMQGSGLARIARIQHIEVVLTGSQRLTCRPDSRGRPPFSRRTFPLTWFADLPRLKTLVIHINESGKQYVRRKTENAAVKKFMTAKTAGQPNTRMTRALRCVQGLDYIYQLRGLKFVKFYDFQKALDGDGIREPVRDWSFLEDVSNVVTMPKVPKREEQAQLENLEPLVPEDQNWQPSAEDWELVKPLFIESNGRCSYEDLRQRNRDANIGSSLNGSTAAADTDSLNGPDASDGSQSSGDSDPGDSNESGIDLDLDSDSDSGPESSPADLENMGSTLGSAIVLSGSDSDAGSSSSSSDSDSPSNGSHRSISQILSSRGASFSPVSRLTNRNPRRASTSSGLFMTPGPNSSSSPSYGVRTTLSPKTRESTGLFVTPGPSGRVETPRLQQAESVDEDGRTVIDLTDKEEQHDEEGYRPLIDLSSDDDNDADNADDEVGGLSSGSEADQSDVEESDDDELELFGGGGIGSKRSWSGGSQGNGKRARLGR